MLGESSNLLISSIVASLLAAVALVIGARQTAAKRVAEEPAPEFAPAPEQTYTGEQTYAAEATYADEVESVDRPELADALDHAVAEKGRGPLDVLLQVDLADPPEPRRGGVVPADLAPLTAHVAGYRSLMLRGLMAVAPLGEDPGAAFTRLAAVAADLRRDHPEATVLSAGMSHDLEQAVEAGATHVRVGTAVLGGRPALG